MAATRSSAGRTHSRLRDRRLACGLTQGELAARAGVSRQLVAAVEAGHNAPAVEAALGLAGALGTSVERLFGPPPPPVSAAVGGRVRESVPLRVARVGERLVAAELPDHGTAGAAWASPDAMVEAGKLRLFSGANPGGLAVAGCDPAIGVAEALLHGLGPRSLLAIWAATGTAVRSLERGRVHAALVHGPEQDLPRPPIPAARMHLARWQVGIATTAGRRRPSLEGLLGQGTAIVQREAAASSQQALRRAAAKAGYKRLPPGPRAGGHIEAARIAALSRCAAVTTEAAARAFDLDFLALEEHTVEVWVAERWREHPGVDALFELLASPGFTDRVAGFGGYDLKECGTELRAP